MYTMVLSLHPPLAVMEAQCCQPMSPHCLQGRQTQRRVLGWKLVTHSPESRADYGQAVLQCSLSDAMAEHSLVVLGF